MPRPQFSLKTMLWLMKGIAAVFGTAVLYPPHTVAVAVLIGGALAGACVGATKSRAHAVLGAILGFFLAGPFMFIALIVWRLGLPDAYFSGNSQSLKVRCWKNRKTEKMTSPIMPPQAHRAKAPDYHPDRLAHGALAQDNLADGRTRKRSRHELADTHAPMHARAAPSSTGADRGSRLSAHLP